VNANDSTSYQKILKDVLLILALLLAIGSIVSAFAGKNWGTELLVTASILLVIGFLIDKK
jgi:hypothetical protein